MKEIFLPFIISLIAGLSTLIGYLFIYIKPSKTSDFIGASLAFSMTIMMIISITDLIPESLTMLKLNFNGTLTILLCFVFMVIGIIFSMLIDYYLPSDIVVEDTKLYKVGIVSMLAIILHNIPEGIATYVTGVSNKTLAISLTIAIALHNIPEGISIAVPIYYSTKSKFKAFLYTLISAISEPFGALIAFMFLSKFNNDILLGILFAIIAGIMSQISICELLPTSRKYNYKNVTLIFFIIGSIFMLLKFIFV